MQTGVEFSFCEKHQLDCLQGSNWPCCSALSTRDRSQEGIEGEPCRIQPSRSPKEPDDPVMLPHQLPICGVVVGSNRSHIGVKDGGRQPSLQPLLQKGHHDSDRALPGVFSVRRAPFNEQVQLQGVSMSRRQCSRRSDGVDSLFRVGHLEPPLSFQRSGRGCHKVSRL